MNTPVYAVLNDLSLHSKTNPISATKYKARAWVKSLYELFIRSQREGVSGLRTYLSFDQIQLIEGYSLREWSADNDVDQDIRLRIIDIFSQLAHAAEFPENQQGDPLIECRYNQQIAHGIWGAISLDSFSISLLTHNFWDTHKLLASVDEMDEETGEVSSRTPPVEHLSRDIHLPLHREWLQDRTKIVIANGNMLWMRRGKLFPSLSFCKNTEMQVKGLVGLHLLQVIKRLNELETACRNWKRGAFDKNTLPHCTPESEATLTTYKTDHSFECSDGETRLFSLHTRFTPGAGRIFFYPHAINSEERVLHIGHIGPKLPNVSY